MPDQTVEELLAQARRHLLRGERLDPEAWAADYPAHAAELRRLLPVLAALADEVRTEQAVARGRERALAAFKAAFAPAPAAAPAAAATPGPAPAPAERTLGEAVTRIAAIGSDAFLAEIEQAGLPRPALEKLRDDRTPLAKLQENRVVKAIADRIGLSFRNLKVALGTLLSMDRFFNLEGALGAATRDWKTSTPEEIQELLRRIREEARRDSAKGKDPENPA